MYTPLCWAKLLPEPIYRFGQILLGHTIKGALLAASAGLPELLDQVVRHHATVDTHQLDVNRRLCTVGKSCRGGVLRMRTARHDLQ